MTQQQTQATWSAWSARAVLALPLVGGGAYLLTVNDAWVVFFKGVVILAGLLAALAFLVMVGTCCEWLWHKAKL